MTDALEYVRKCLKDVRLGDFAGRGNVRDGTILNVRGGEARTFQLRECSRGGEGTL